MSQETRRGASSINTLLRRRGEGVATDFKRSRTSVPNERARPWWLMATLAVMLLAFVARLVPTLSGGGLTGLGNYDDGVYYTAATALVNGRVPYRDFLLLHPPGLLLVVAPFAWLGSHTSDATGFALARVGFMVIGALNAALVLLVLRRFGSAAAISGGVFYALFYPAVYAERSTLLEPLGTLGILMALLLLSGPAGGAEAQGPARAGTGARWRVYAAGAALGAGVAVKIWYVVAVLVIAAAQRGHSRWRVLTGAGAGAGVICLPFFVAAPTNMVRYVVTDQLGRAQANVSMVERLESIFGLDPLSASDPVNSTAFHLSIVVALAIFGTCAVVAARQPGARVFAGLLAAHIVVLLASPSYFGHYSILTASPLALVFGVTVGKVATVVSQRHPRPAPWGRVLTSAAVLASLAFNAPGLLHPIGTPFPAQALRPAAARVGGCVQTDDPTVIVELNVLTPNLRRGCRVWPDVTGWTYDTANVRASNGHPLSRPRNPIWQHIVLTYLRSGSAVVLARPGTGLANRTRARLTAGPVLASVGQYVLRRTTTAP